MKLWSVLSLSGLARSQFQRPGRVQGDLVLAGKNRAPTEEDFDLVPPGYEGSFQVSSDTP